MTADITFFAAFFAGFLSFVSPCVLPLVPPYLGFLAGVTIEELVDTSESRRMARLRVLAVAACFVLGFSTVFITLGATASAFGQILLRNSHWLATIAGFVIIFMGMHFLGLFRLRFLYREVRFQARDLKAGPMGAYLMGLAFAFGWTPCIGPILATILAVAGARETVGDGAVLLAVYSAGLGVPFLLAALFAARFMGFLKRFRTQFDKVEKAMGAVLVVTGVFFLTGTMQTISFWLLETFPLLARLG